MFFFLDLKLMPVRTLFTKEELGVTRFERLREDTIATFQSPEQVEEYKKQFVTNFGDMRLDEMRDNLKKYIMLIDGKPDELNTLKSLLVNYYKTYNSSVHHVSEFVFGTPVMRLLYHFNLPDEAVKVNEHLDFFVCEYIVHTNLFCHSQLFNDSDLKSVFEQMQTYKVLLDLLYKNKRYAETFELYDQIRARLDLFELFPDITMNCLAFAACYHLVSRQGLKREKTDNCLLT